MRQLNNADGLRYHFTTDIPSAYNTTVLRILPCNPRLLYVYWELPLQFVVPSGTLQLRLCVVNNGTGERQVVSSHDIPPQERAHYIEVPDYTDQSWVVELGVAQSDDDFSVICTSALPMVALFGAEPLLPHPSVGRDVLPAHAHDLPGELPDELPAAVRNQTGVRFQLLSDAKTAIAPLSSWQIPGGSSPL